MQGSTGDKPFKKNYHSKSGTAPSTPKPPVEGPTSHPVRGTSSSGRQGDELSHNIQPAGTASISGNRTASMGTWPISKSRTKPDSGLDD